MSERESSPPPEEKKLDDVLAAYLSDCFVEDGNLIGHFDHYETFTAIIFKMKDCGYTFSVRDSDLRQKKTKTSAKNGIEGDAMLEPGQHTIFYHLKAMSIKFFGLPFTVEKTTHYQCTYGCKYYKSKAGKWKRKAGDTGNILPVKKRRSVASKKMGCMAKMTLKKITVYPDYRLDASKGWREKKRLIENLRRDLGSNPDDVQKICRYYLNLSMQSRHNHPPIQRMVVPKSKRQAKKESAHVPAEVTGSWVTLYSVPSVKDQGEPRPMTAQDATFFNSLVKFPANTVAYDETRPGMPISLEMSGFDGEVQEYHLEPMEDPSVEGLQIMFKEKLKRLFTLSESCSNAALLARLVTELEQADQELVNDIGYDPLVT